MSKIEINEDTAKSRIYEAGVLLVATLGDEGAAAYHAQLQGWVTSHGGEILAEGSPERFDLAYPMSQIRDNKKVIHNEAYLAWFKYTLDASLVREFEDSLARDLNIIRKIVFKTVRENTYIPRKSPRRREARSAEEILVEGGEDLVLDTEEAPLVDSTTVETPLVTTDEVVATEAATETQTEE